MKRQEFINELRIALQGQVDQATINDNISYYETYIMQEARKGSSEEEVTERLGSPRLIAKTIIDDYRAEGGKNTRKSSYADNTTYSSQYNNYYNNSYNDNNENSGKRRTIHIESRSKVMAVTAIIALIVIVFGIIALIAGVISLLAPILIPILLILLVIRLLSRK